jgi:PEP-CTERM motif
MVGAMLARVVAKHELNGAPMRVFAFALVSLLATASANAAFISIEPDDFAVGQQITSDHAIVSTLAAGVRNPVYASLPPPAGMSAPTGTSMFASDPDGAILNWAAADRNGPLFGLLFEFLVPVHEVSVYALNLAFPPGLGIQCFAYGAAPDIGCAADHVMALGESHLYTLRFDQGIDRLLLGGGHGTSAIGFDRLEARVVPEPSALALMCIGLFGLAWRRSRLA